ncbi:MAG TPA: hypothetical protein VLF66_00780 [Thermoanaerobaculia bacterium]|nr:hypothetical protein [Thermoanaerobaculia bacterium]
MREPERDEPATFDLQRRPPAGARRGRRPGRGSLRRTLFAAALALAALQPAAAGDVRIDGSFVSTAPTGTPPLSVSSTTRVENLNADLLDGLDASAFSRKPAQILWVSPSGGDFTTLQGALDSITDASASKPYLVRVGPGIYVGQVVMKPFVDIEGSGEGVTILRAFAFGATVTGASKAELRDLTVENFGGSFGGGTGIHNASAATRITRVTVRVESAHNMRVGIANDGSPPFPGPVLRRVTVSAQGQGTRTTGVQTAGTRVTIFDSQITAAGKNARAISNGGGAVARLIRVEAHVLHGDLENDTPIYGIRSSESETEMVDVNVTANGGLRNYGAYSENGTARARMRRVRVFAHAGDGAQAHGVYTIDTPLDLVDCEIQAVGGTSVTRAVLIRSSNVRIYRSTLNAAGGSSAYGLYLSVAPGTGGTGTWSVEVHASQLWASTFAVNSHEDFRVGIGGTWLGGARRVHDLTGSVTCAGVYDESFTFYSDSCN